jgi:Uma2 family endonuclease
MSQPAVSALAPLPFELVYDDGRPLETKWHAWQIPFLREVIRSQMKEQGRTDFFVGGNQFVYYSPEQAWEVVVEEQEPDRPLRAFRGPDVFWVGAVDPSRERQAWVAWEEGGRLPDVIIELLSPSTEVKDRTEKKDLYAQVFRTSEYFLVDPKNRRLDGFRLKGRTYRPIPLAAQGRLWSEQLGAYLGFWFGVREDSAEHWVRLFRADGSLVPTEAEAERQRADAEQQRADALETEMARLRALLAERGQS